MRLHGIRSNTPKELFLLLAVCVNGGVVLAVEILGARAIGPFFGTTIFVWSSLITVTLGGLAAGYFLGGALSRRFSRPEFLFSGAMLSASLLLIFVPLLRAPVFAITESAGLRLGPLAAALFLFFPFFLCEGLLAPLALHIRAQGRHTGLTAGMLYGVSTVGSLAGSLLAGFVLVPLVALPSAFKAMGALLLGFGLSGIWIETRRAGKIPILAALLALGAAAIPVRSKSAPSIAVIDRRETFYSSLRVVESEHLRCLLSDVFSYSCVRRPSGSTSPFAFSARVVSPALRALSEGNNALFLGSGAGVLLLNAPEGVAMTLVEIDPVSVELGKRYFGLRASDEIQIVIDDARHAVRNFAREGEKFDLIVVDIFSGAFIPPHVSTREAFADLASLLTPSGSVIMNGGVATTRPDPENPYVGAMMQTAKSAFPRAAAFWGEEFPATNIVFVFSKGGTFSPSLPEIAVQPSAFSFTDDLNPIEHYTLEENLRVIRLLRNLFSPALL